MKLRPQFITSLFAVALLFALTQLAPTHAQKKTSWKAGVARVVITPDKPTWMAGYAARTKPSEGKLHDIAQAMSESMSIVGADAASDIYAVTRLW
jgi:hypothetical protein